MNDDDIKSERRHQQLREAQLLAAYRENLVRVENALLDHDSRKHIDGVRTLRSVIGQIHERIEYLLDAPAREAKERESKE